MKKLLFLFVFLSSLAFGQDYKGRAVLDNLIIGVDDVKSIQRKIDVSKYNVVETNDSNGSFVKITYKLPNKVLINILLVNNTLFSVKYYPYSLDDKLKNLWLKGKISKERLILLTNKQEKIKNRLIANYKKYLNTEYNAYNTKLHWFNSYIDVSFDNDDDGEFFVHYDSLKPNYLQYIKQ